MLIKLICLIIGTIALLLLLIGVIESRKYAQYITPLDDKEFPYKEFYGIGWFLSGIPLFQLKGKTEIVLKKTAKLMKGDTYANYYAGTVWAQFLTASLITVCFGCVLAGVFPSSLSFLFLGLTVLVIAAEWNLIVSKMKEQAELRTKLCDLEFANMVFKLSQMINSGMILREAWFQIAYGKDGAIYDLMKKSCEFMSNGDSESVAIEKFGILSDSNEIKKFSSSMVQGLEKGNSDLGGFLMSQASEQLSHKRQMALQEGEKAAGKLIIPLGITFAGILMIILSATMKGMIF